MNVLITGASRGIGLSLTENFLFSDDRVIALSRSQIPLDENNFKGKLKKIGFDITDRGDRTKIPVLINEFFGGRLDVIINNAGALKHKPLKEITEDEFDHVFNVNVKGAFFLTQKVLPFMREGSQILNIGSMAGYQGSKKFRGMTVYSSSKGALSSMTECMAEELSSSGILVNLLALGAVHTNMFQNAFPGATTHTTPKEMALFIHDFVKTNKGLINGKLIPVSRSTP